MPEASCKTLPAVPTTLNSSNKMSTRRKWWVFCGLLAVAIAFRVVIATRLANDTPDDAKVYSQLARNVLEQHVYSDATEPPFAPVYIRTPGYPFFLAAIYSAFGHGSNTAVRIIQALIDTASCVLVALLAQLLQADEERRDLTMLGALGLAAVNPFTTIYTATLLPEVTTTFLALALSVTALLAVQNNLQKRALAWWALTGFISGLGVLVRPDSGLFAAAAGLVMIVACVTNPRAMWRRTLIAAVVCFLCFSVVLLPWTLRNWRTFHVFQPLAPATALMPDEYYARGYSLWLSTWLDDQRYVDQLWWELGDVPISIKQIPAKAFDSADEKNQVEALLDKYNHPDSESNSNEESQDQNANNSTEKATEEEENTDEEEVDPEDFANQQSNPQAVEMTPEIDEAFAKIAAARISRAPIRYYLWMSIKRSAALWLNTHSDYYPFSGDLFPLSNLDYDIHQHIWLPFFGFLVGIYTLIGWLGAILLWRARNFYARIGLLLIATIFISRFVLFSRTESLESRYVVELFPFLAALGGILFSLLKRRSPSTEP